MVTTVPDRDNNLTEFGKKTLKDRYLLKGESFQDLFKRVAVAYSSNDDHAQRMYDYMSKLWFMPATPVLANGGADRGLPISCFLNYVEDTLPSIIGTFSENCHLSNGGGGIGTYWGAVREIGSRAGKNGKTSGIMPFMKVQDSLTLAVSQGSVRNGSAAAYLPVWHPEIMEFLDARRPTGGDPDRKTTNLHQGVVVDDKFMQAVENDEDYQLVSILDGSPVETLKAREIWIKLVETRMETGEPYIMFLDTVNKKKSSIYKKLGLNIHQSNLCAEIALATGPDNLGNNRTAVCCLSSLNLDTFDEWKNCPDFIGDIIEFLDNVMEEFIRKTEGRMGFEKARYSAMRERSVGLGVMGFHDFLQRNKIPFGSAMAKVWNNKIFSYIKEEVDKANEELAVTRGSCPDAADAGESKRFVNTMAIAPTASISVICGGASPSIEPWPANVFIQKTLSGTVIQKNKYLEIELEKLGMNTAEVWRGIEEKGGSVQHIQELGANREVFLTAYEIDQAWVVMLASDRQQYIDQSQSVNLFFPADADKKTINQTYLKAWKYGLKSLYYQRSTSVQRAKSNFVIDVGSKKDEECLACQ